MKTTLAGINVIYSVRFSSGYLELWDSKNIHRSIQYMAQFNNPLKN